MELDINKTNDTTIRITSTFGYSVINLVSSECVKNNDCKMSCYEKKHHLDDKIDLHVSSKTKKKCPREIVIDSVNNILNSLQY